MEKFRLRALGALQVTARELRVIEPLQKDFAVRSVEGAEGLKHVKQAAIVLRP